MNVIQINKQIQQIMDSCIHSKKGNTSVIIDLDTTRQKIGGYFYMGSKKESDPIRDTAKILAIDVVSYYGKGIDKKRNCQYIKTMRRTINELSTRHEILFKGMVNKLQITRENGHQTFEHVADELFADNTYNWGRIVSLYAFAAKLAKYCVENDMEDFTDKISESLGSYVDDKLGGWIKEQGGWNALEKYFPDQKNLEDQIWKGLLFTAVGLGALATMVVAR